MRVLAILCGGFALGTFLAQYLLDASLWLTVAWGCLLLGVLALFLPTKWRKRMVLCSTGLALALGWNWLYFQQVFQPMNNWVGREDSRVELELCGNPTPTNFGAKVPVKVKGLPCGKAIYYGDHSLLDLVPGQILHDQVKIQSAERIRDDDVTIFTSKGIFLRLTSQGEPVAEDGTKDALRWIPLRLGRAVQAQIETLWSGDHAGFLRAILTGDKQGLSKTASSDLSEAGLFHVLAVSGMHCGFLLTLVTLVVGQHRRRLLVAVTLPLLIFYALLVGGSPSVVRACVMLSFLLIAPLVGREGDPPTAMMAALALILLQNPFAAASISLQLSFASVAGLLWLTPKLQRTLMGEKQRGRVYRFLAASFSATMGALVFTIPLSAYYFGILVLVAPFSNLLCLWAASLVFLLGLPIVLLSFLTPTLAGWVGLVPQALTWYILHTAHALATLPYHALYFVNPYLKVWLLYAYLLFGATYLLKPKRRWKYAVAGVLAAVTLMLTVSMGRRPTQQGTLNFAALDVGQGECILMNDGAQFALMDCGSGNSWRDAGGIAADQLMTMGCRQLDYLILSHYDSDHVNGIETLMARLPVKQIFLPDTEDDAGLRAQVETLAQRWGTAICYVREETRLDLGDSTLTVYPPVGTGADNERGLSALCTRGETDFLITGDMGSATERKFLAAYPLPDIEVLVAGHHGSNSSSCKEFLRGLQPERVLISVGDNAYGHPAEETLYRIAWEGAEILRTDLQGSIFIFVN